jgi:hypothetical protein
MQVALIALAFQLGYAAVPSQGAQGLSARPAADSLRDLKRARSAQSSFERARRYSLPERGRPAGRCDVHLGRYCWWYDDYPESLPPEPAAITRRRAELLATLDLLGTVHPGDEWIAGMRVYYRIDAKDVGSADSVARSCAATTWWCLALSGYTKHVLGRSAAAESAFAGALAEMSIADRCAWRDISVLLPSDTRKRYEKLACPERRALEDRYWLLSRPQLAAEANEWRTEFYVRRVLARLAERAATPQAGSWGRDAAELVLRYGWPVGWSRVEQPLYMSGEPSVVGHDPVPSFNFAPVEALLDTLTTAEDDGWDLHLRISESRFAPRLVRHVAPVGVQIARFRRGDSVLVVSAYAASHDSLGAPSSATLGVTFPDGTTRAAAAAEGRAGTASLMLEASPTLAGVEIVDTTTHTLARARALLRAPDSASGLALSDLLLFRIRDETPQTVDAALERAIPGDTLSRERPVGIYWETYGVAEYGEGFDVGVTVERIDRSWFRGARQLLRLAAPDNPLRLRWNDARPAAPGQAVSRAISLDLRNQHGGRYRITVGLIRADGAIVSSAREIDLRER